MMRNINYNFSYPIYNEFSVENLSSIIYYDIEGMQTNTSRFKLEHYLPNTIRNDSSFAHPMAQNQIYNYSLYESEIIFN